MTTTPTPGADVAPYRDPDGYRSWQPDPHVRALDAWHRRLSAARGARKHARAMRVAAEVLIAHCGPDMTMEEALATCTADAERAAAEYAVVEAGRPVKEVPAQ